MLHHIHESFPPGRAGDDICIQRLHRLRGVLGIASANANDGIRVLPAAAADHRPVLLVRYGGDGAGVDDIGIAGGLKGGDLMPPEPEELLHSLRFILIDLAAQGIESNFHIKITILS